MASELLEDARERIESVMNKYGTIAPPSEQTQMILRNRAGARRALALRTPAPISSSRHPAITQTDQATRTSARPARPDARRGCPSQRPASRELASAALATLTASSCPAHPRARHPGTGSPLRSFQPPRKAPLLHHTLTVHQLGLHHQAGLAAVVHWESPDHLNSPWGRSLNRPATVNRSQSCLLAPKRLPIGPSERAHP